MDLKEYQKDESFPPDKTDQWAGRGRDEDHWVLSHNSLRGELDEVTKSLEALKGTEELKDWQVSSLKSVWSYHSEHVKKHHDSEEMILQPFVSNRVKYPESISGGHKELEAKLDILDKEIEKITEGGAVSQFAELFAPYKDFLLEHLKEEEDKAIPLIHAFFTPEEFKETGKAMGKKGGHAGSFVYYIGEEKFRNETMAKLGIPFFVWYLAFRGALNEYRQQVIKNVTALEKGEPPEAEGGWLSSLF